MIYLFGSILFASLMFLMFNLFERYKVQNLQAIVINYFTAGTFGLLIASDTFDFKFLLNQEWLPYAIGIGMGFILIFNLMAITTQKLGASVAAVTVKMSVAIPVLVAYYLYAEEMGTLKIVGIAFALLGIYFSSKKEKTEQSAKRWLLFLPAVLFLGGGTLDSLLKYTEITFIGDNNSDILLLTSTIFWSAGLFGSIIYVSRGIFNKRHFKIQNKDIGFGSILGIINYGSIFCLISALNYDDWESSVVFPINNVGIVVLTALSSVILFHEKLSKINKIGIAISVLSILIIALS